MHNVELLGDMGSSELSPESKPTELLGEGGNPKAVVTQSGNKGSLPVSEGKIEKGFKPSATVAIGDDVPAVGYDLVDGGLGRPFSASWAGSEWFDPNDPGQGLSGTVPMSLQK